jgi:hypothetical protein
LTNDKRSSKPSEGKGNVIVSVRVRPDAGAGAGERSKTDGEWMVDGRRSLVAYRGKEGGDYYYGTFLIFARSKKLTPIQIMFLLLMTIMRKSTILLPRGLFGG